MLGIKKRFEATRAMGRPSILGAPTKNDIKVEPKTKMPLQRISQVQMKEIQWKGLCYNCDNKWHVKHEGKTRKLFLMDIQSTLKEKDESFVEEVMKGVVAHQEEQSEKLLEISLYALIRNTSLHQKYLESIV